MGNDVKNIMSPKERFKESLQKVKPYLPTGYVKTVSDTLQVNITRVRNVSGGVIIDYEILAEFIKLAEAEIQKIENFENRVEELSERISKVA